MLMRLCMDYLILKYFVGSIYDGGADEYIPLKVPDKDAFLIFLLDKLDSACKELNEDSETRYLNLSKYDLSVNGVVLPLSNFISYSEKDKKWEYVEPDYEDFVLTPGTFIVTTSFTDGCTFSFPVYHYLQAQNKEDLEISLKDAYKKFTSDNELKNIEIGGAILSRSDLVYYESVHETRNNKKHTSTGNMVYRETYNVCDIIPAENWFDYVDISTLQEEDKPRKKLKM